MTDQKRLTLGGIFLSLFLLVCVLTRFFRLPLLSGVSLAGMLWISRFGFWVVVLIIYLYARNIEKEKFLLWAEQKVKPVFFAASVVLMPVMLYVVMGIIYFVEREAGHVSNRQVLENLKAAMCNDKLLLLFGCLTAAFTEELLFRGYLLPRLQLLFGRPWMAIVVSSLLFGLAHFGYGEFNLMLFPFLIGIFFGMHYYKYRSLAVLITCHFLIDFISLYPACK